ncbi:MAG: intein-containing RctB family protein [Candidatus Bathyarchaeia archaeon]
MVFPSSALKRVDRFIWEIPQSYKQGMRVPGRVYADEALLEKMLSDATLEQCANVSFLPGIYKWSITLPDGHEGYGFPIGGVAATDYDEGVVSPGGVGYDINCLSGDSSILHELGFRIPIERFEGDWARQRIKCVGAGGTVRDTGIIRFLKLPPKGKVFRVRSKLGYEVMATEDHPFLTPAGMIPLRELDEGDLVAVHPFQGVPYEEPPAEVIIAEGDIEALRIPCDKGAVIAELRRRGLIPLKADSPKFPILLKIMGFLLGDGSLTFTERTHCVNFFGRREDLEDIRADVRRLGFTPSRIYSRRRRGRIRTKYGEKGFETEEFSFKVVGRSFPALLMALGVPNGSKARRDFLLPHWLFGLPLWQKRLFLASFFGAELSAPKTMTGHGRTFYAPILSQNKKRDRIESGFLFMRQIAELLKGFGVSASVLEPEPGAYIGVDGVPSARLRLQISGAPENLIKLWSAIGFEYNREKSHLASAAVAYLILKREAVLRRAEIAQVAVAMRAGGATAKEIYESLGPGGANYRFIERSAYEGRTSPPRIPADFPAFQEFLRSATRGLGRCGAVWDEIAEKEEITLGGFVYDFTVEDPGHNFIANNFIVSNCGVRAMATNLTEEEIRPSLSKLLATMFDLIPSGLGSRGQIRLSPSELDRAVEEGVQWAIDRGYGWPEDAENCEEGGCMEMADASKVSQTAKSRGAPQLGSLGSGNHFIEIDRVDKVFDERAAKLFGIEGEGSIVVFVHTGSRGFGHQICSDYLRIMERATHKYGIKLPDRELACAPGKSREAEDYLPAMAAACNFAWVNRQMITHWTREAFQRTFKRPAEEFGLRLIYDVAHNIAKIEEHGVDGAARKVFVHRKGATRAFPPGHSAIPKAYREIGQPVLIPGSMGTSSWIMLGSQRAMEISFGSTAHGAGRYMSRAEAKRRYWGSDVKKGLEGRGILVMAASMAVISEEAPDAYKDVDRVAEVSHSLGIATKVARLVPIGVAKG